MATAIGTIGAAAGVLSGVVIGAGRIGRRLHDVHTAVMGEPARIVAGVTLPAVPGFGERLATLEREFIPNHGTSLRDAVDRVEAAVQAHVEAPLSVAHPPG